jgi:hypothetical protein
MSHDRAGVTAPTVVRAIAELPMKPWRATVLIDGAPVTILPRRAPVGNGGPIRGRTLAIFPGDPPPRLSERRDAIFAATVEPGAEPGFAVLDLGEGEAATLGRALGLVEILYWDGRRALVLACGDQAPASP